ncbi:MAG TPA: heavy-metal-associated domain-containing protein [Candidatus Limnocylindria bacterium]|nr:heavy-metal-associated domain-containing protein [Candidatus Limnocylindria bacterium]
MDITNIENAPRPVLETDRFGISGMTCDKCVQTIENALRKVNGVQDVKVDRQSATATVTFDRAKTNVPALHDAVLAAGYTPSTLVQR